MKECKEIILVKSLLKKDPESIQTVRAFGTKLVK